MEMGIVDSMYWLRQMEWIDRLDLGLKPMQAISLEALGKKVWDYVEGGGDANDANQFLEQAERYWAIRGWPPEREALILFKEDIIESNR